MWELATAKMEHVLEGSERFSWVGVAWSPDGACVATGEKGAGTVRVWDAATGDCVRVMENLADCISSVAWSPLGNMLACASLTSVHVWDVATGTKPKHTLQPCEVERRGLKKVMPLAWSPDGAASLPDPVHLWTGLCECGRWRPAPACVWCPTHSTRRRLRGAHAGLFCLWQRIQDFASTTCRMGEFTWTVSRNGSTRGSSRGRPAEL